MDIETVPADQALASWRAVGVAPDAALTDLDGVTVVRVRGEVDLYTGPSLRATLHHLLPPPVARARRDSLEAAGAGGGEAGAGGSSRVRAVVVDLTEVTFIDSHALGVLVHGHHLARPEGRAYAVVATSKMIHKLFEVTGLARVMPLHPDVLTAVRGLRAAGAVADA